MLEFLQYPFMIRALVSGIFVSILLGWLGTFVVTRKMSFIGDGIAHASLSGIALAILLGWAPIPTAVILASIIAVIIYFLEKKTNISSDMAIAIMLTTGMAIGIILLSFYQGYQPELMSYLFGTFDPVGSYLSGINNWIFDLLLYVSTAIVIILSIKLVGVILVSSLLVTPSAIAKMFVRSFKSFTWLTVLFSVLIISCGLILSYYLDLPSGATIILTGTALFILAYLFSLMLRHKSMKT